MNLIIGDYSPERGYAWNSAAGGKIYGLRRVQGGSELVAMAPAGPGLVREDALEVLGSAGTPGLASCHITLLPREAVVADYTSGSLSVFPLSFDGLPGKPSVLFFKGSGPVEGRQASAHVHSSWVSPDFRSLVAADLGADRLYVFGVRDGALVCDSSEFHGASVVQLPAGCGPRHCAFSADGKYLYVVTELSDEVLVLDYPGCRLLQRLPLHEGFNPQGGGHIVVSPDGKYVYASLRVAGTAGAAAVASAIASRTGSVATPLAAPGEWRGDLVAVYLRDAGSGMLKEVGFIPVGGHPRHFALSADGSTLVVACRDSDRVEFYSLSNGLPVNSSVIATSAPVSVLIQ